MDDSDEDQINHEIDEENFNGENDEESVMDKVNEVISSLSSEDFLEDETKECEEINGSVSSIKEEPIKRKRGRPPKAKKAPKDIVSESVTCSVGVKVNDKIHMPSKRSSRTVSASQSTSGTGSDDENESLTTVVPVKRKRGRPSSATKMINGSLKSGKNTSILRNGDSISALPIKRKRGRKRGRKIISDRTEMENILTVKDAVMENKNSQSAKDLICELGRLFYNLGWVSGTGGGISIREGHKIFVAPSGVQKERLSPEDIFTIDMDGNDLALPDNPNLVRSQCTPLFLLAYTCHNAGAVIHSHSKNAVIATLAYPGKEFKITHLEMIKAIYHSGERRQLRYDESLIIPIIENTPFEKDLEESMHDAMLQYPYTNAILVRRHGVYVWGETWEKAKTMAESYDYLFEMAAQMTRFKIDPTMPP